MRIKLDEIDKKINGMSKKQKIGMLIVACCFGIIILAAISNTVVPDQNTNNNSISSDSNNDDIFNMPQEKHYTPNITDNFTYMGEDYNDIAEEYQYGLTDNEGRYCRFDWHTANKIAQIDPNTRAVYEFDMEKSDGVLGSYDYQGSTIGSSGINHIFSHVNNKNEAEFTYECENGNFTFTTEQRDVSNLKNQTIITAVYYPNGTEIRENSSL